MDSIHPIIPQAPTMPPVTPSSGAQRVNRDGARSGAERVRRRRTPRDTGADGPDESDLAALDRSDDDDGDGDDPRPRIDITV